MVSNGQKYAAGEGGAALGPLLAAAGVPPAGPLSPLAGDGSSRRFFRFTTQDGRRLVAVLPPRADARGLAEARSTVEIGRHLRRCGAPVPAIVACNLEAGLVVFEDLGDRHLAAWIKGRTAEEVRDCYRRVVRILVDMQVRAAPGMEKVFCHEGPRYDRRVMLERESGYFVAAFVRDYCGVQPPAGVAEELARLAHACARLPAAFFLHRDFQSRNIMIADNGQPWIIDFQAGRLGPPAYDLAALVRDPYVNLDLRLRYELVDLAGELLAESARARGGRGVAWRGWAETDAFLLPALQRNLQVVAALAFLGAQRKRPGFLPHLPRAVALLAELLTMRLPGRFPLLAGLVAQLAEIVEERRP